MTRNTLTYLANVEQARHNRATESQAARELAETKRHNIAYESNVARELSEKVRHNQITEMQAVSELTEQIQNNLRTYKINLDKNTITKLANDQLNERESKKLAEVIANNLRTYEENKRHNLTAEKQNQLDKAISGLNKYLEVSSKLKIGKTEISGILASIKNLFGGKDVTSMIADLANMSSDQYSLSQPSVSNYAQQTSDRGQTFVHSGGRGRGRSVTQTNESKKKEENEIPSDFSSSQGPSKGGKLNEVNSTKNEEIGTSTKSSSSKRSSSTIGPGAGIPSSNSTGKASVIYSPGAKQTSYGPGSFIN